MKISSIAIFLLVSLIACQEKTLLSEELRNVNPYRSGQKLTFVADNGNESTLEIRTVKDGRFPDALGAFLNERLVVTAFRESKTIRAGTEERIVTLLAKTDKEEEKIDFCISLKEAALQMGFVPFSEYKKKRAVNFATAYRNFDDVLIFENPSRRVRVYDEEIVKFYWSKSTGYVRLIQRDGTVWDLKSIE